MQYEYCIVLYVSTSTVIQVLQVQYDMGHSVEFERPTKFSDSLFRLHRRLLLLFFTYFIPIYSMSNPAFWGTLYRTNVKIEFPNAIPLQSISKGQ
jgi:hypothetical protein